MDRRLRFNRSLQQIWSADVQFAPDAARARSLDDRMHRELAASLLEVGRAVRGVVPYDEAAFDRLILGIESGDRVAPGVFGRYYDLVRALLHDDVASAGTLFAELASIAPVSSGVMIEPLRPAESEGARYIRLLRDDGEAGDSIVAPSDALHAQFITRIEDGLALLDATLPDLAGEIRGLVRRIITIASDSDAAIHVDGGSHYQLWGALFLNAGFHHDAVAVAEVLAHESAHAFLFGLCIDEPLVRNPPDEVFASPLRTDPRPMDGIFHATFVAARMHWAMTRLADDATLTATQRNRASRSAQEDRLYFEAGRDVVARDGLLTPLGRDVMEAASVYMQSA